MSPNNGVSMPYRPTPLVSDSIRSAFYVNGMYSIGAANESNRDQVSFGQLSLHASHNLGYVQVYYGGLLALGAYQTGDYNILLPYHTYYDSSMYVDVDTTYQIKSKGYFFGNYGFFGGMNLVIPHHRGEWRAIGFEANFQSEFGKYYDFRKHLNDSAADVIFEKHLSGTISLFTELVFRKKDGNSYGFKFAVNSMTNPTSDYSRNRPTDVFPLSYFSLTFHATQKKLTAFMQINAGELAKSFQCGMSYRFAKVKKRPRN